MTLLESVPTFTNSTTLDQYRASFDVFRCVLFKQADAKTTTTTTTTTMMMMKGSTVEDDTTTNGKQQTTISYRGTDTNGPGFVEEETGKKRKFEHASLHSKNNRGVATKTSSRALVFQKLILETIESSASTDRASWAIEQSSSSASASSSSSPSPSSSSVNEPSDFLSPTSHLNGYRSFVLQDNTNGTVTSLTSHPLLTHPTLPIHCPTPQHQTLFHQTISPAGPYWFFLGRNNQSTRPMEGRNEHTDDVAHNGGTYHYQAVGSKTWFIRPTEGLREHCDGLDVALKDRYEVTVEEGDVFVIDTRLWWHRTEIPGVSVVFDGGGGKRDRHGSNVGSSVGEDGVSISYARDLYLDGARPPPDKEEDIHMCSEEGAWATAYVEKGTVMLTDINPPVTRTKVKEEANCRLFVVEEGDEYRADSDDEEDENGDERTKDGGGKRKCGRQLALVPFKDVKEGEFFIVLESDSEEDESENEGEENVD